MLFSKNINSISKHAGQTKINTLNPRFSAWGHGKYAYLIFYIVLAFLTNYLLKHIM